MSARVEEIRTNFQTGTRRGRTQLIDAIKVVLPSVVLITIGFSALRPLNHSLHPAALTFATAAATRDIPITVVLPSGSSRTAEVPADVPVRELIPELSTKLELPTTGPDGRPMHYRLDSKALGRELKEDETLGAAGVPEGDRLMMTADVTAG